MWYYDSKIIKSPKTMVISGITHPKGIFKDSAMLTSLGIKPYREVKQNSRYYDLGSYSVDTSGDEVVGTYAGSAKSVASIQSLMLEKVNDQVKAKMGEIDWYWQRAAKGGTAVPTNIANYATTIYSEHETKKTEIAALNTLAKCIEYENRAFTEVRKDQVLYTSSDSETQGANPTKVVGEFKEWHASKTTSYDRTVDMCIHWTANPNDPTDAGLVSLTAD